MSSSAGPKAYGRTRDPVTRRAALRLSVGGAAGLSLARLLRAEADVRAAPSQPARAKSCILFFLEGGPSHIDLWDMKPQAPDLVRGIYRPIDTSLLGLQICEHLPDWAPWMHRLCVVRSVSHSVVDHNAGTYYALTGKYPVQGGQLVTRPGNDDHPPIGSVVAKLRPGESGLPDFAQAPDIMFNNGTFIPGQQAGLLGSSYDPFFPGDPSLPGPLAGGLAPSADVAPARLASRRELLARLAAERSAETVDRYDEFQQRAYSLVASPRAREAFDLSLEPDSIRRRYGLGFETDREARQGGGLPSLGQSLLLARRLIEAGVRLVTVTAGRRYDQSFDTHRQHYSLLTHSLLPYLNRGFAALMQDLTERGLLDETLVAVFGEFGRTPKLGQITSPAGATPEGRDHWPHCYTAIFAGAGLKQGYVHGASDRHGAYPLADRVAPEDLAATIFEALGVEPRSRIIDAQNRPHTLCEGTPITALRG